MTDKKFDLNDIVLIPAEESDISSRSECNIHYETPVYPTLPLMAAPMDTVVSSKNYTEYIAQGIMPCIPRGLSEKCLIGSPAYFQAFGLCDIEKALYEYKKHKDDISFNDGAAFYHFPNVLIDIANGHMHKLIPIIKEIKLYWPDIKLMVGNIANPETFINLGLAGADYVRCSIGTGCFIPGQIVKLNNNEKNIEDVAIGDEVLTHLNEYKKIISKFEYYINDEIYEIDNIRCTQNHEFYVIEKEYKNIVNDENIMQYAKWISAKDLDINKHLLVQY